MAITFPDKKAILETIELLIGEKPLFKKGEGWDLTSPPDGAYITFLQGKDDAVDSAIITDLAATLYIGGKLILLPDASLQDQYDSDEADEPVVEAVTEVINNLRTLFNNIERNPHVAPTKTFPYKVPPEGDFVAWVRNPGQRIDYVGKTPWGDATLTLIAR